MQWVAVAIGGAIGAMGRFALTAYLYPVLGNRFPLGTLLVNILGCFLVGICYVLIVEKGTWPAEWRFWLIAGFLGALTTFSTFSLDAVLLWQNGHGVTALMYVMATFVGCLVAVVAAISLMNKLV